MSTYTVTGGNNRRFHTDGPVVAAERTIALAERSKYTVEVTVRALTRPTCTARLRALSERLKAAEVPHEVGGVFDHRKDGGCYAGFLETSK